MKISDLPDKAYDSLKGKGIARISHQSGTHFGAAGRAGLHRLGEKAIGTVILSVDSHAAADDRQKLDWQNSSPNLSS
ncbi:MAG: hypothetical protein ABSG32_09680 [Terriglobia bacterium]|jgi:hypothetical protein